jgi:hypothetical protein
MPNRKITEILDTLDDDFKTVTDANRGIIFGMPLSQVGAVGDGMMEALGLLGNMQQAQRVGLFQELCVALESEAGTLDPQIKARIRESLASTWRPAGTSIDVMILDTILRIFDPESE